MGAVGWLISSRTTQLRNRLGTASTFQVARFHWAVTEAGKRERFLISSPGNTSSKCSGHHGRLRATPSACIFFPQCTKKRLIQGGLRSRGHSPKGMGRTERPKLGGRGDRGLAACMGTCLSTGLLAWWPCLPVPCTVPVSLYVLSSYLLNEWCSLHTLHLCLPSPLRGTLHGLWSSLGWPSLPCVG
jgi:hypothetical protein